MKLLFATLLALIAGISCDLFPTEAQLECLEDYVENNPENKEVRGIGEFCPNVTDIVDMPEVACGRGIFCLANLDEIYRRCGYNNLESFCNRQCLINEFNIQSTAVNENCGNVTFSTDLEEYCPAGRACIDTIRGIYSTCADTVPDNVCDGSVKTFAAPLLVFLFAAVSILF